MAEIVKSSRRKEFAAKTFLSLIFFAGFGIFIGWALLFGPGLAVFHLTTLDIALLGFATYRMGHLLSYDLVMEPLRSFFTDTIPDPTGEGETVEAKGEGLQRVIGQLMCCPVCTGTWAAAGMVYALYWFPGPARVFITIMAVIGVAEILNAAGEMFSWGGQYARNSSGAINHMRRQHEDMMNVQAYPVELRASGKAPADSQHYPPAAPSNEYRTQTGANGDRLK